MNLSAAISDTSLVMVAVIPSIRDLDIARLLGWYRIPLKSAPKIIAVDYLAFYQTSAFPKNQQAQIRWLAPILGHELTTRAELMHDQADHPRAREEYFKIQLGPLIELTSPLPAKNWKRVTFFYTTGQRMKTASSLDDLPVHDEERPILWQALRERALKSEEYQANELPEILLDPALLALLGGFTRTDS
ncbi:MAG: hypothetical protein GX768_08880 [Chloroflexi bacterium]|nr:hypothetical protein [Chloroflexota bacterium]